MTGNLKLLSNFVEQFLGTVKLSNDPIKLILSYGDLVQGNVTIKRVYYVEGLNYNLLSIGQFYDADLEVAFRKSTCYICDLKGNDLLIGSRGTDLYSITLQDTSTPDTICLMAKASSSQAWLWHRRLSHLNFDTINLLSKIEHQTSTARTPKQNGIVERRNRTFVEVALTMLSAAKVPLYFWAEAIAIVCFTQNRSLVIPRHEKTPYHIINGQNPHIFGLLCYIIKDGENLYKMKEKGNASIFVGYSTQSRAYMVYKKRTRVIVETIHVNFDELPQMSSDHVSSDPVPQCPTMALIQSSLSPHPQSQQKVQQAAEIVTTSNELDLLFSLMFDELLNGTTPVVSKYFVVPNADTPDQRQQHNITTSTSITVAIDIPPLNIQKTPETTSQAPTQAPNVTATENINQAETNKENAQVEEDEFINIFSTPVQERWDTSSRYVDSSNMHTFYQRHPSEHHWTNDHPFEKNIKEAMAVSAWIEAMQEELHQFDRLDIHQSPCGIFINQAKYAQETLKKHGMTSCDRVGTLMATKPLDADLSRNPVNQMKYRNMVGALM
ncbi:integrase, catalytic region, zinc finger, CCHC-type containing protein [Tanacetum coccineum]